MGHTPRSGRGLICVFAGGVSGVLGVCAALPVFVSHMMKGGAAQREGVDAFLIWSVGLIGKAAAVLVLGLALMGLGMAVAGGLVLRACPEMKPAALEKHFHGMACRRLFVRVLRRIGGRC